MPAFVSYAEEVSPDAGQREVEGKEELRAPLDAILRFGRHDDFDRLAFEASGPIDVDALKSGGELVITFDRAIEAALPPESAFTYRSDELPQVVFGIRAEDRGRRYRIGIDPNTSYSLRHWSDGRLVVVDIAQDANADATGATEERAGDITDDPSAAPSIEMAEPPLDEEADQEAEVTDEDDGYAEGEDDADGEDGDADDDEDETEDDFTTVGAFEVYLGGSLQFGVATAEGDRLSDGGGDRGYAFVTDADIDIEAFTTFADDIEVGVSVTLEAEADVSNDTANADEAYIYLENRFGQMQLGRTSGAEDDMALGADTIAAGTGGIDGDTANLGDTQLETSGDAAKISYFTPRISGFQAGVSYTPDTGDEENDNDDGFDLENHVGVGLNYVETYGDVEVSLATVGSFAKSEFSSADDLSAYAIGGTLGFDAVELGASYGRSASDFFFDYDFATIGATLGFGEASAGIGYNFVDDKSDGISHIFVLSGDTPILPGVDLQGDVSLANPEGDSSNVASVFAVEFGF